MDFIESLGLAAVGMTVVVTLLFFLSFTVEIAGRVFGEKQRPGAAEKEIPDKADCETAAAGEELPAEMIAAVIAAVAAHRGGGSNDFALARVTRIYKATHNQWAVLGLNRSLVKRGGLPRWRKNIVLR